MQNMRHPIYPSNPADLELFERAREVLRVRGRSDKSSVGAAVRTDKGIFIGLDLKSRKSAICAEPGAISAAYSAGGYLLESIIAVCKRDEEIFAISPCGACRELLNFHAPDCRVVFGYEDSWVDLKAKELFRYPIIFGLATHRPFHREGPDQDHFPVWALALVISWSAPRSRRWRPQAGSGRSAPVQEPVSRLREARRLWEAGKSLTA